MMPSVKKEKEKSSKKLKFKNFRKKKRIIFRGAKMLNLKAMQNDREHIMLSMAHNFNKKSSNNVFHSVLVHFSKNLYQFLLYFISRLQDKKCIGENRLPISNARFYEP